MNDPLNKSPIREDGENLFSSSEFKKKLFERIHGISSIFSVNYPINPKLRYEYPPINQITLENILNALISHPQFYVQTLHLMNKMNLPCPLVSFVRTSRPRLPFESAYSKSNNEDQSEIHLLSDSISKLNSLPENEIRENFEVVNMRTSESESELESEEEQSKFEKLKKRPQESSAQGLPKRLKMKTLIKSSSAVNPESKKDKNLMDTSEIFEKSFESKTTLKAKPKIIINEKRLEEIVQAQDSVIPATSQDNELSSKQEENGSELKLSKDEFISQYELEKKRLKLFELKDLPVFKNYNKGEPNNRLYLKNVAKKVEENDLKLVYGRYIDWSDENQAKLFDIQLKKTGPMKGQAFVTLPNKEIAQKALDDTNGFVLFEKPIVVSFSRSAKAS